MLETIVGPAEMGGRQLRTSLKPPQDLGNFGFHLSLHFHRISRVLGHLVKKKLIIIIKSWLLPRCGMGSWWFPAHNKPLETLWSICFFLQLVPRGALQPLCSSQTFLGSVCSTYCCKGENLRWIPFCEHLPPAGNAQSSQPCGFNFSFCSSLGREPSLLQ